jgi:replicative DNA helicase
MAWLRCCQRWPYGLRVNVMHDERALIGALLNLNLTDATRIRGEFRATDLNDPRLRVIVGLVDHCLASQTVPDSAAVLAAARTTADVPASRLSELGHMLITLAMECPIPASASVYALGVVEASTRRRIKEAADRLNQAASADLTTALDVVTSECLSLTAATNRILEGQIR